MAKDNRSHSRRVGPPRALLLGVIFTAALPAGLLFAQTDKPAPASGTGDSSAAAAITIASVKNEIENMKAPHPWAGIYIGFRGITSSALYLAPSGRYCAVDFLDYGPSAVGRCGLVRLEGDRFVRDNESKTSPGRKRSSEPLFLRVPWGGRNYLVPEENIVHFINEVNGLSEPRYGYRSPGSAYCYLRGEEYGILVTGGPTLPPQYGRYLLSNALTIKAASVGPPVRRKNPYSDTNECVAAVRFEAGSASRVFIGMELYPQRKDVFTTVVISSVGAHSSSGNIEPVPCKNAAAVRAGVSFSSRPLWLAKVMLSTEPMSTEIVRVSTKSFGPFWAGKAEEYDGDEDLVGAAQEGFSLEKIARVKFVGPFKGALEMSDTNLRMDHVVLALGGNLVRRLGENDSLKDEEAGGIETRELLVYSLRYRGRPILTGSEVSFRIPLGTSSFHEKTLRLDWKKAAIKARAQQCGLNVAGYSAEAAGAMDLLGWTGPMMRRAQDIRLEDLAPRQREAAERFVAAGLRTGRVWPLVYGEKSEYLRAVQSLGDKARREFERRHPAEAEECEKLEHDAWSSI